MESPMLSASPTAFSLNLTKLLNGGVSSQNLGFCLFLANGYSSVSFRKVSLRKGTSMIVAAKKHRKNGKKADTHNFIPKPDEATGPFPEAVLLKEKKVQEDGRHLPEFVDDEERELFEALNLQFESDLNIDRMRHYEVVYLIHEDCAQEVESVNMKVQDFVREKKGKVWRFSDWGMRRLAYKIQKAKRAHYILMNFELEAQWINDFKSMLDRDERVIRHLVIKRDKAETEVCPPPPEFHTLRADMVDDDVVYDDEFEDEDWKGEDENEDEVDTVNYNNYDTKDGVIYVDDDDDAKDDKNDRNNIPTNDSGNQKRIQRADKVVR